MAQKTNRPWRIVHSESSTAWGGQEVRILTEMKGFRSRGCTVALLAPDGSCIRERAAKVELESHGFSTAPLLIPWTVLRTARWLRRFKPDVVNPHSSRDGWIIGLAARLAGVPLLIRSKHFDVPMSSRFMARIVYEKLADHLVTTSHKISDRFRDFFNWPDDRLSTIPTGLDLNVFTPVGPKTDLFPPNGGKPLPVIGVIGVLRGSKGHEFLLKAARLLRDQGFDAHYAIIGEGPMRPGIEAGIRDLRLSDRVLMTGYREDVPAILRGLDLVAIPSKHEGIPQAGLQALATKVPVVGSNIGGVCEIIRHGETGRLVPPQDPAALAAAIREALTDKAASAAMAERGRTLVEREHGVENMLDQLDAIYRRHLPGMKIALIRRQFAATGGAELYAQRLLAALANAGHEPHLLAQTWQLPPAGVVVHPLTVSGSRAQKPGRFADAVENELAREKFDCVLSLERTRRQDVYRAGDGLHRVWLQRRRQFAPAWKKPFIGLSAFHHNVVELEAQTFDPKNTRRIIVNSQMVKREILEHFPFPEERIHLVRNGVDAARFQNGDRAGTRRRFGVKDGDFLLLFVGSGWERKGLKYVLQAFRSLNADNVKLLIVGKGSKPMSAPPGVIFAGPMADVEYAYAAADLFVFLPIYEPSANVVIESLAAGLPVVTSALNGAAEWLMDGTTGTVVEDPSDIAAVMNAIQYWKSRGGRARDVSLPELSLERNVAETLAVLNMAAQDRRR